MIGFIVALLVVSILQGIAIGYLASAVQRHNRAIEMLQFRTVVLGEIAKVQLPTFPGFTTEK